MRRRNFLGLTGVGILGGSLVKDLITQAEQVQQVQQADLVTQTHPYIPEFWARESLRTFIDNQKVLDFSDFSYRDIRPKGDRINIKRPQSYSVHYFDKNGDEMYNRVFALDRDQWEDEVEILHWLNDGSALGRRGDEYEYIVPRKHHG